MSRLLRPDAPSASDERERLISAAGLSPERADAIRRAVAWHDRNARQNGEPLDLPEIPRHRLIAPIGEGGHGIVFLGQAEGPPGRLVAVKVLRRGGDSKGALRRFEAERAALLLLDHPSVIAISDAGVTADRRPFFVMPYVPGDAITGLAEQRDLGIRARTELFVQVLSGVVHAHARGILHRDLKPGNVLAERVEGGWRVRIIDWGLACAFDEGPASIEALRTESIEGTIGTPEFMSPEQAAGGAMRGDARSDIWSLGALLYLLLCNQLPFPRDEVRGLSPRRLAQYLRERTPLLPSRAARIAVHAEFIRGDLDAIVMRAMAADPERRYQTAAEFADDLRAHLEGRAVAARPDGVAGALARIARRHRGATAALLVLVGTLVASTVISLRALHNANAALASSETSAAFLEDILGGIEATLAKGRDRTLLIEVLENATARLPEYDRRDSLGAARVRLALANAWDALGNRVQVGAIVRPAIDRLDGVVADSHPVQRRLLILATHAAQSSDDQVALVEHARRVFSSGTRTRSVDSSVDLPVDSESCKLMARIWLKLYWPRHDGRGGYTVERFDPASPELAGLKVEDLGKRLIAHVERARGFDSVEAIAMRLSVQRHRVDGDPHGSVLDEIKSEMARLRTVPASAALRASAMSSAMLALSLRGQHRELVAFCDAELPEITSVVGAEHPSVLTARFNRSSTLFDLGEFEPALAECLDVARALRKVSGPNAPMTKWVHQNAFRMLGVLKDAARSRQLLADYRADCAKAGFEPILEELYERLLADIGAYESNPSAQGAARHAGDGAPAATAGK